MSTRNKDKVQKAARKIECLLNEEKEYKHKELDLINERLKQTECELDKLRSYLLGCYYTDEPTSVTLEGPAKSENIEADDMFSSKRLIIGNVSKYITADQRENINDRFIYKWLLYLRTPPDCKVPIETFVSKVHFTLDPSYIPNHEVELTEPPFEVRRRGWGEFAVKVKIFFKHQSQPVEVTHNLTLDTTFSGVQTPGSETHLMKGMTDSEPRYSDKYFDDVFEYRHVTLPEHIGKKIPSTHLLTETEWRNLGVQQSPGWVHYMTHSPERHILLFRRPKTLK